MENTDLLNKEHDSRLLSCEQLAKYIGMSRKFVFKHVSSGRMPGVVRVGRYLHFDRNVIDRRITSGKLLIDKQDSI